MQMSAQRVVMTAKLLGISQDAGEGKYVGGNVVVGDRGCGDRNRRGGVCLVEDAGEISSAPVRGGTGDSRGRAARRHSDVENAHGAGLGIGRNAKGGSRAEGFG